MVSSPKEQMFSIDKEGIQHKMDIPSAGSAIVLVVIETLMSP